MHVSSLKNVVKILKSYHGNDEITWWRQAGRPLRADENIIFPEICVSREYNNYCISVHISALHLVLEHACTNIAITSNTI